MKGYEDYKLSREAGGYAVQRKRGARTIGKILRGEDVYHHKVGRLRTGRETRTTYWTVVLRDPNAFADHPVASTYEGIHIVKDPRRAARCDSRAKALDLLLEAERKLINEHGRLVKS